MFQPDEFIPLVLTCIILTWSVLTSPIWTRYIVNLNPLTCTQQSKTFMSLKTQMLQYCAFESRIWFNPHSTKPWKPHWLTTHLHAYGNERVTSEASQRSWSDNVWGGRVLTHTERRPQNIYSQEEINLYCIIKLATKISLFSLQIS